MTVETIYFIHHSHTDIGYTHDQPILFDLVERFLSEAVHLVDKYTDRETNDAFRWTVETTYVLSQWLDHAPPSESLDPDAVPVQHRAAFVHAIESIIAVDGEVAPEERDRLIELARLLSGTTGRTGVGRRTPS